MPNFTESYDIELSHIEYNRNFGVNVIIGQLNKSILADGAFSIFSRMTA